MTIRKAEPEDAEAVAALLDQLGYAEARAGLADRIRALSADPREELFVAEEEGRVAAVMSLHFIPQLALNGSFARISYLCVDEPLRHNGIGRRLLEHAERLASERGCDRIELHCHARRTDAHRFYAREGYEESPKYLVKRLR